MTLDDLKSAKKTIGAKQTAKAIKRNSLIEVFIACDCDERISEPIINLCLQYKVACDREYTMEELGKAVNIKVGAAAVGVLK